MGCLTSLEQLDLEENQLERLPHSIGQLKSLQRMNLYDNKLNEIPESILNR